MAMKNLPKFKVKRSEFQNKNKSITILGSPAKRNPWHISRGKRHDISADQGESATIAANH
jgi:hypothetical protein